MTFSRLTMLREYWDQQPPTHILVDLLLTALGCKIKKKEPDEGEHRESTNDLDALMSDFQAAGGR